MPESPLCSCFSPATQCYEVHDGFTKEQQGETYADLNKSFTDYFTLKQNTMHIIFPSSSLHLPLQEESHV
jgi:hypothetical protein